MPKGGAPIEDTTACLGAYRAALYGCFTRARDALFDLGDALATDPSARSFLTLVPSFHRRWPSLYAALKGGCIDRVALRRLFVQSSPVPAPGARLDNQRITERSDSHHDGSGTTGRRRAPAGRAALLSARWRLRQSAMGAGDRALPPRRAPAARPRDRPSRCSASLTPPPRPNVICARPGSRDSRGITYPAPVPDPRRYPHTTSRGEAGA